MTQPITPAPDLHPDIITARETANRWLAAGTPAEPVETTEQPEQTPRQALAEQLHRIADDITAGRLPLGSSADLHLGVLESRADLERFADRFGSKIKLGGTDRDVPLVDHQIRLDGSPHGPSLIVRAQIQPDGQSEVERLRAEVAKLRAQAAGGAA